MKDQPARLDTGHALSGQNIDRSRPGQFRLNGRAITFFAGDTVLSAVLANGVDSVGWHDGHALALTHRHAPAIAPVNAPHAALPMERTPATDGADYLLLDEDLPPSPLARLFRRDRHSLGLDLAKTLPRPWLDQVGTPGMETDLVVVGAGVAGMSAALAGARRGLGVTLIEARPHPGGIARLFGTQDGEDAPDETIARLGAAIAASDRITLLTRADVFAIRPGLLRLHQVVVDDGQPHGRVVDLAARHVILATGSIERLPLFSGNRLPGVMGLAEAFALAHGYGVWPGASALFATSSSPAYRLAMLARDAGIAVPRILDCRTQPQSRFIEFSKAYGMTLASGTLVAAVTRGKAGLSVLPHLSLSNVPHEDVVLGADRLVVCGGFQPDLTLWHMAGGDGVWNADNATLKAVTGPDGVTLIGSAAGWQTRSACMASGEEAVNAMLGRPVQEIADHLIDPIYETPDAPAFIGQSEAKKPEPTYLDGGHSYLVRPQPKVGKWPRWRRPQNDDWSPTETPFALGIAEVAAGVQLGVLTPDSAGPIARERAAMINLLPARTAVDESEPTLPPPYLQGRYPGAKLWLIAVQGERSTEPGALLYPSATETDPLNSVGVVLRVVDKGVVALVLGTKNDTVSLRDPGHITPVTLAARWRQDMD